MCLFEIDLVCCDIFLVQLRVNVFFPLYTKDHRYEMKSIYLCALSFYNYRIIYTL